MKKTSIFVRAGGSGPPLLLLHGFPETHVMWRDIAVALAPHFSVVAADLRGYGQSGCPASGANHAAYSKRAMARDMVQVMDVLGFDRFMVAGHDRGGRVAYRMALDHREIEGRRSRHRPHGLRLGSGRCQVGAGLLAVEPARPAGTAA
ncbi:alpha/beta fold hydrolase [Mesorhizobium sp. M0146]|uniref:alpha/beta fold hydrolase n=1 Tax=unclassified Mesorhizobium TaxID=325217 RepID=UPI00333C6488